MPRKARKPLRTTGGQGGNPALTVLGDDHHTRSDLKLLGRAVREEWPVKPENRPAIIERLEGIVAKKTVEVVTKEGKAKVDGPADTNAIGAASVLERMVKVNQADRHHVEKIEAESKKPAGDGAVRILIVDARTGTERPVASLREFYDATAIDAEIEAAPPVPLPAADAPRPQPEQGRQGRAPRR